MATEYSEVASFYANKSILITGATSFLGKVLIEKLLRSCPDLKKIYALIRPLKGFSPQQRFNELLDSQLFEVLSRTNSDFKNKVQLICGDMVKASMGISPEDELILKQEVNIVFHLASSRVKGDEPIREIVQMNVVGTQRLLDLCKQMPEIKAFVFTSTAFSNCNRKFISERVYKPPMSADRIVKCTEWMSDSIGTRIEPYLLQRRPNSYTYTKAITEWLVKSECGDRIPCAIVRPSLLGASWSGPFPGWVDSLSGMTALLSSMGKGLLRTIAGNSEFIADIIPVDFPANMMIVAAWSTSNKRGQKKTPVYNHTTGQTNYITWGGVEAYCEEGFQKYPFEDSLIYPSVHFTEYRFIKSTRHMFQEVIPAYLMDVYLGIKHERAMFVDLQSQITRSLKPFEYFTTNEWDFNCRNVVKAEKELNEIDRKTFYLDVKDIDWRVYFESYCLGLKKYLYKEDMSKISEKRSALTSFWINNSGIIFIALILFKCLCFIFISLVILA